MLLCGYALNECPLWVKSGHHEMFNPCPLYPQKRTLLSSTRMSAKCQTETHAPQQKQVLFDHLVGNSQEFVWNSQAQRLGGPEIDQKLKCCRLLDWQVAGVCALENPIHI